MLRKKSQKTRLNDLYQVKRKRYKRAAEKLKQQIETKAATIKRHKSRLNKYRQNSMFQSSQPEFCQKLDGKSYKDSLISDKE